MFNDAFPRQRHAFRRNRHCAGFTYLGLLFLVALIGLAAAAALQTGSLAQRRMAEEELLNIGMEYRNALLSYANATPAGLQRSPRSLQDLLKDPRYPQPRRHLRRLYPDPLTGKEEWGLIQAPDGSGIVGVYSLSEATPFKVAHFDPLFADFTGKKSYRDWRFMALYSAPSKLQFAAPAGQ